MKFPLEDYQQQSTDAVLKMIDKARRDYTEDAERTAVGLCAPTGAGKTVIATALLEALYFGTADRPPSPEMTILWLTDDRSLNAQTISKVTQCSQGKIDANRIRYLADTDEQTLEPGLIYFVHIQSLQKNSGLHAVRPDGTLSDKRSFGAWEMIAETIKQRGADFLVFWDEAHRGSGTTGTERSTIAGTIVNGGTTNVGTHQPPTPVVVGISATPDKFKKSMNAAGRTLKLHEVTAAQVRDSGLLKDRILIRTIAEAQTANATILTMAVQDLRETTDLWRSHHDRTGDPLVTPLLILQVPQGVPTSKIGEYLTTIETAWPQLSGLAIAHAFGDPHGPLKIDHRHVRYIPPEAISDDDQAQVVLFKSALVTGWDCPRAEVLVSFQNKDSFEDIAQLIGRLVRTPLASRIVGGDDRLNEVSAYLPGFRSEHVARVVEALSDNSDAENVDVLISPEVCQRSTSVPTALFDDLDTLPSYARTKRSFATDTARLVDLAAAVNHHGIVPNASLKARTWIVDQLRASDSQRREEIDQKVADILAVQVDTTVVSYGKNITSTNYLTNVSPSETDLDKYFLTAQRLLPDASAAWYYADLCDRGFDDSDAAARVAALAALGTKPLIEGYARTLIDQWRTEHRAEVTRKPRLIRDQIETLWQPTGTVMHPTTVAARAHYPAATEKVSGDKVKPITCYPNHLYVVPAGHAQAGLFPVDTSRSSWEADVLAYELGGDVVGWYRNPSSGKNALAIAYTYGDQQLLMHPDFLFWYDDGNETLALDIVDPHRHDLTDTSAKWAALARYAQQHHTRIRRCLAVTKIANSLRALDLTEPGIDDALQAAIDKAAIESIFADRGVAYG